MPDRKYGIVVPVLRNFKGLAELFWSIREQIQPFIVPNWQDNRGVAIGWNNGIYDAIKAGCTHILVCNDDIVLGPSVLERCARELDTNPDVVLATGCNIRDEICAGRDPRSISLEDARTKLGGGRSDTISDGPDFSCFMILPKTIDDIGYFDENFSLIGKAYFEDNDYHRRIKLAGKRGVACNQASMFHRGSQTQNMPTEKPVVTSQMFEANREYYKRKWGGIPGHETCASPYGDATLTLRDWIAGK